MENFNKNWLLILLVAVIFGTLGFLLGRTTGHGGQQRMMKMRGGDMKELHVNIDDDDDGIVKIDTIMKDGKQIIIKEVRKTKD